MAVKKLNRQEVMQWLNARHVRERAVLLVAGLGIVGMLWLSFVHDALTVAKETESRNIAITNSRIAEEQVRQNEIRGTFTNDPNSFAMTRRRELSEANDTANARLNQLYGDLISPQQMSQVLTRILQNETKLDLISAGNTPPETLLTASPAEDAESTALPVQVFKHGFRMVFEGNFIDTVYYLRSLERLDGNFFWEDLKFEILDYPNGRISLQIYTLSTEQGWIGV